jgi:two-component system, chemotaxis family, response regulator Rcp1
VSRSGYHILVVEDNQGDVFLIREAIYAAGLDVNLHVVPDGEKAVQFFQNVDRNDTLPRPTLVVVDINLPKQHGGQVIEEMRKTRRCADALVLVVTSSDSAKDREEMGNLGVNGYFRKPSQYDEFMKLGDVVKDLLETRSG